MKILLKRTSINDRTVFLFTTILILLLTGCSEKPGSLDKNVEKILDDRRVSFNNDWQFLKDDPEGTATRTPL